MSTALTLVTNMAKRFDLDSSNGQELMNTLKQTAFKGNVSDAQFTALMVVAQQYGLNPFLREIYAFQDRNNGIVPVVGVDGWSRIINENPQFDGIDFQQDEESCTCIIYRKDRNHPIRVTEYMAECKRTGQGPWQSHPKRMLRHKSLIQAARLAFGFSGIYDQDEAERIMENQGEKVINPIAEQNEQKAEAQKPIYSDESFQKNKSAWRDMVISGKKSAEAIIKSVETKAVLTEEHKNEIDSWTHEQD